MSRKLISLSIIFFVCGVVDAQEEKHRIVGNIVDEDTVNVNGMDVDIQFRGRTAEIKEHISKIITKTLYGKLSFSKETKTFSLDIDSIDNAFRENRVEIYNGYYPITSVKRDYCLVKTKYGVFKFFFRNLPNLAIEQIRRKTTKYMIVLVFYYDDEAKEICVKRPSDKEIADRVAFNTEETPASLIRRGARSIIYLKD